MNKSGAPQTVKAAGLKSLSRMIELTGVPRSTLEDWHEHHTMRERFNRILKLCVEYDKGKDNGNHNKH